MAPRVQTFAWRLLTRAIATGARAGRYSVHISKFCSRCQAKEDDIHMLFLCPFARAAWFAETWCIRSDTLVSNTHSITEIIQSLMTMNHPNATMQNIFTFLWCLWKARNDAQFGRKFCKPSQMFPVANAIMQASKLEDLVTSQEQSLTLSASQLQVPQQDPSLLAGNVIFCDTAWKNEGSNKSSSAGIGITLLQNRPLVTRTKGLLVTGKAPVTND
jgi:hypothetical protein